MRLVRLAVDDLEAGGGLFGSELVAAHYEQALIAGLLAAQPNTSRTPVPCGRPGDRVGHRRRRALGILPPGSLLPAVPGRVPGAAVADLVALTSGWGSTSGQVWSTAACSTASAAV